MTRINRSGCKNYTCNWFTSLNPALFDTAYSRVALMGSWQQRKTRHRELLLRLCPLSRVWRSAFFDMESVYFEDYAGVSPQWLAVRVRVQGGLIPAGILSLVGEFRF